MNETSNNVPRWWQVGPMWLVVLGPVTVVIAGFITLFIAIRIPDPVVSENYYREGLALSKPKAGDDGMTSAVQARDHVAPSQADGQPAHKD